MKKFLLFTIITIFIAASGLGAYYVFKPSSEPAATEPSKNYPIVDACEIFTLEEAQGVLGSTTTKGESGETAASNDDITVSTCTYTYDPGTIGGIKTASVLARSPKSEAGVESNRSEFDPLPEGTEEVTGVGEMAFWNPELGQLNVLKSDVWLIISSGGNTPSQYTLADARVVADVVVADVH